MVYSGLELGQYFELESGGDNNGCHNVRKSKSFGNANFTFRLQIFMLLTPLARMILSIAQMQFICKNKNHIKAYESSLKAHFSFKHNRTRHGQEQSNRSFWTDAHGCY